MSLPNLSYSDKKSGWWIETKATVPCAVSRDGAVVKFNTVDVLLFMDQTYPSGRGELGKVWYFNESKDREIAELRGDEIVANPQILWRHYLPKDNSQSCETSKPNQ